MNGRASRIQTPGIVLASAALALIVSGTIQSNAEAADPTQINSDSPPNISKWMMRTARLEGASVDLATSAQELIVLCQTITTSGRLQRMAELRSDVDLLNQQIVSTRLATDFLLELRNPQQGSD